MLWWEVFEGFDNMRGVSVGVDIIIFVSYGCESCCTWVCM